MGPAAGRVIGVNVSPGGVPKLPVPGARVGRWGLEGDAHSEPTVHGGPHRAVALFAIEAIRRVAAEGHPIGPGTCGENLTTEGIEWSTLSVGTRVRVGDRLVLELSAPDNPCSTIRGSFSDGRFARISILTNPTDSRMYARVIEEGDVRPGDPITLLAEAPDPRAAELAMLSRLDAAHRRSSLVRWQAALEAGIPLRLADDGELAMAALPGWDGPAFNRAHGFEGLPNLVGRAVDFFADAGVDGLVDLDAGGIGVDVTDAWLRSSERLARTAPGALYVAELDGLIVASGSLHVHKKVGWLRATAVVPAARGRGIQRALIGARASAAAEAGCTLVGSAAAPGSVSDANLRAMGLVELATRDTYSASSLAAVPTR